MKIFKMIVMILLVSLIAPGTAVAGGPFGPPQPIVKEAGGIHTGVGYWFHEDTYQNGTEQATRQNQVYSELGYGSPNGWEITARVGMSDLKMIDAFSSGTASTAASKKDFEEQGKFFSTVGAKGFYPFNNTFGIGAVIQGTYCFSDFTDTVSGTRSGGPFSVELRVKSLWDVNFGMGFQATVPYGIKIYIGPYVHHSEFKVSPSADIAGVALASGETTKNKTGFGGFAGIEVPLAKGFRLNLEGQYSDRLSVGTAVIYVY
jgi:opacity protein-like surface antigen